MDQGREEHAFHVLLPFLSRLPPPEHGCPELGTYPPTLRAHALAPGSQDPLPELASRGRGQQSGLQGALTLYAVSPAAASS